MNRIHIVHSICGIYSVCTLMNYFRIGSKQAIRVVVTVPRKKNKRYTQMPHNAFILFFWQHTVVDDKICPMNMERPISLFNFMFCACWVLNLENNNLMLLGGFNNDKIKTMINHQDAPILRHIYP